MNITSIDLVSSSGVVANLSFKDPGATNPYIMKNLYGLDADEILASYVPGAAGTPKNYSLSMRKREVVMRIVLNPDFSTKTYSDLRDDLYRLVQSSRTGTVTLNFKQDAIVKASISGFVSKFEVPVTQQEPELQITLNCTEPVLLDPNETILNHASFGSSFTITDNVSTAPHGVRFGIRFLGNVSSWRISNNSAGDEWNFAITTAIWPLGYGTASGDEFHVSSVYNDKQCYAIDFGTGTQYGVANVLQQFSQWPIILPGANPFYVTPSTGWEWLYFKYNNAYWGI